MEAGNIPFRVFVWSSLGGVCCGEEESAIRVPPSLLSVHENMESQLAARGKHVSSHWYSTSTSLSSSDSRRNSRNPRFGQTRNPYIPARGTHTRSASPRPCRRKFRGTCARIFRNPPLSIHSVHSAARKGNLSFHVPFTYPYTPRTSMRLVEIFRFSSREWKRKKKRG